MREFKFWATALVVCVAAAGCGGADDESVSEESETPEASVETAAAEPEVPSIFLPEGFPEGIPMYPDLELIEAEVVDAEKGMYRAKGSSRSYYEEILTHYEGVFREAGWTEEMAMAQEGTSIISVSKDGMMVTVEANEGGLGCYITYTTGNI